MHYSTVKFDSIVNKIARKDDLFLGKYTLDPYQKCEFRCRYCDSSTETEVIVKDDAPNLVDKELQSLEKGVIIIGSVHDPYQPVEEKTKCVRSLLEIIKRHGFPVHILTKSTLVLRDVDILSRISACTVTVSIMTTDAETAHTFEPYVPLPNERLQMMQKLSKDGISVGVALMPILPYITDAEIEQLIKSAKEHDAQYILWEYLELKGDQREEFMNIIKNRYPEYEDRYMKLYINGYKPSQRYIAETNKKIRDLCGKYGMKSKITEDMLSVH
jgi:DNA repair photolyase